MLTEEKLNETDQFNRLLLEQHPDVIIKLSADWKILDFNSAAEQVFGKKCEYVVNKNYLELFVPEPERDKTKQQMDKLLKKPDKTKIKMKAIGANGVEMEINWTANVLHNKLNLPMVVIITTKK